MTRYRWVTAQRAEGFSTKLCYGVVHVGGQAFYRWRDAHAEGPTPGDAAVIGEMHVASDGTYGSTRVTAELRTKAGG